MKVSLQTLPSLQFEVQVTSEEYDSAPPVSSLLIDRTPRIRQNDRDAIAAYLAFGAWASAGLTMPGRISPATAAAIRADSGSINLDVGPIEYYPKALPIGESSVTLTRSASSSIVARPELTILRSDNWNGALATKDSLAVGANAFVFGADDSMRAHLAVAVLLAADLRADSFVVSDHDVSKDEQARIRALLGTVRLGIHFASDATTAIAEGRV